MAIEIIKELGQILKFKNIEVLSPTAHDELISFLSQLTHIIAISLMNCHKVESMIRYTGDSFHDLTRIAKINENLWLELFTLNKDKLIDNLDSFVNELTDFKNLLINNDIESMRDKMITSTEKRKLFYKKDIN